MEIKSVKGTHDVIKQEANFYSAVEGLLSQVATFFGYSEIRLPVLEHSELFIRGVGESSDVVRKEMYTFDDKGGRSLTLRPEFTAGIMRSIVQNKLYVENELPLKLYYCGPVFRYERPQLGRYRQFNQFGVESVGCDSPLNDIECITMAYTMLNSLGLENVSIKINTLGDEQSRNAYRVALKEYFAKHIENMCEDCKSRYELNPLRILDCKVPEDQQIVKDAPKMSQYLSKEAKERFDFICQSLQDYGIPYGIDDTLVRGLDYYSETVFEFHYVSAKGNNYGAIGAGGHYGNLVKEVGGPDIPGIGFSFGVERLVSVLSDDGLAPEDVNDDFDVYVMPMGKEAQVEALALANTIRMSGHRVDMCFDNVKLSAMFKRAEKKNAKLAVILGENEMVNHKVIIKDLKKQEQIEVDYEEFDDKINELLLGEEECGCHCHDHEDGHEHCCCHHDEEEHEHCCCHEHKENK